MEPIPHAPRASIRVGSGPPVTVHLRGEFDGGDAAWLGHVLDQLSSGRVVVDLSEAAFLSVAALGTLVVATHRPAGAVTIRHVSPFHRRILRVLDPDGPLGQVPDDPTPTHT